METHTNQTRPKASCITQGVFLNAFSTMKVGGRARFFAEVNSREDLEEVVSFVEMNELPMWILGGGSNTVFSDKGFDGMVTKINLKGIQIESEDTQYVYVRAGAGEGWDAFVEYAVNNNFGGIENLTSIPGTVGGGVVQNIGAYGVEIKHSVIEVTVYDSDTKQTLTLQTSALRFGYRDSVFKQSEGKHLIVMSVLFRFTKQHDLHTSYKDLLEYFKEKTNITILDIRKALQEIRGKKFPNLEVCGTAGSFFKNCVIEEKKAHELKERYVDMPLFDMTTGYKKVGAAWLLDKVCGLRGFREGDVGLFEHQSLVVVNFGNATADEIKTFVEKIKKIFFEKVGIELEEEVIVL